MMMIESSIEWVPAITHHLQFQAKKQQILLKWVEVIVKNKIKIKYLFNPFAARHAYMRQLFHCLKRSSMIKASLVWILIDCALGMMDEASRTKGWYGT